MPYTDRERERARKREYYLANREAHRARCDRWKAEHPDFQKQYNREYRAENNDALRAYGRKWHAQSKRLVVEAYGGSLCGCCSEGEIAFLTIDHIDGYDSASGQPRSGHKLYRWLINHDFPPGFQVLCWNCNAAKGLFGKCPHQVGNVEKIAPDVAAIVTKK